MAVRSAAGDESGANPCPVPGSDTSRLGTPTARSAENGIPRSNLSYAKIIIEDPTRRNMLVLGTDLAIGASGSDFKPTGQHAAVHRLLGTELKQHLSAIECGERGSVGS